MTTYFDWDTVEDNIVEEFDNAGSTIADYTTEPYLYGDLVSQRRSGQSRFYHFDTQGNTTELTDSSGNTTDARRYSAFGETTESTGNTTFPFQYVGQNGFYHDTATGQYLAREQLFSPIEARWLSPSWIGDGATAYFIPRINEGYRYASHSPKVMSSTVGHWAPNQGRRPPTPNPVCQVQLTCVRLIVGATGPKHCGIEIKDAQGTARFHVPFGEKCDVANGRVVPIGVVPSDYYVVSSWGDSSGRLCQCIRATVSAINNNRVNMPYWPIPGNGFDLLCQWQSKCNSNYTTHCLMKTCGIDYKGWWWGQTPVGWNHRMTDCVSWHHEEREVAVDIGIPPVKSCVCVCDWEIRSDEGWCSDPPSAPLPPDRPVIVF